MAKNSKKAESNRIIDEVAAILIQLRESKGLRQKDIANHVNMSIAGISHYETGDNAPSIELIIQLADFYDVSTDYILCRCDKGINFTKIIDKKLGKDMTIGDAVEIMENASKANKEALSQILKLMASDLKNSNQK